MRDDDDQVSMTVTTQDNWYALRAGPHLLAVGVWLPPAALGIDAEPVTPEQATALLDELKARAAWHLAAPRPATRNLQ